jgi:hypothetical protein
MTRGAGTLDASQAGAFDLAMEGLSRLDDDRAMYPDRAHWHP